MSVYCSLFTPLSDKGHDVPVLIRHPHPNVVHEIRNHETEDEILDLLSNETTR